MSDTGMPVDLVKTFAFTSFLRFLCDIARLGLVR